MPHVDRRKFDAWLAERPAAFFRSGDACRCPLAAYLRDKNGYWVVSRSNAKNGPEIITLPPWARAFIDKIDSREFGDFPSGREALLTLRSIK